MIFSEVLGGSGGRGDFIFASGGGPPPIPPTLGGSSNLKTSQTISLKLQIYRKYCVYKNRFSNQIFEKSLFGGIATF